MDVHELVRRDERNPIYSQLAAENNKRLQSFLASIIRTAIDLECPPVSTNLIHCLHVHAVAALHTHMGQYRPSEVNVGIHKSERQKGGNLPSFWRVQHLMDDFVNSVNYKWSNETAIDLASYVLWKLNFIHPFINGNGRTARALCYFVFCVKNKGLVPYEEHLPALITENRVEYQKALIECDRLYLEEHSESCDPMTAFLKPLIERMLLESH